jgi:hypothetical protein
MKKIFFSLLICAFASSCVPKTTVYIQDSNTDGIDTMRVSKVLIIENGKSSLKKQ